MWKSGYSNDLDVRNRPTHVLFLVKMPRFFVLVFSCTPSPKLTRTYILILLCARLVYGLQAWMRGMPMVIVGPEAASSRPTSTMSSTAYQLSIHAAPVMLHTVLCGLLGAVYFKVDEQVYIWRFSRTWFNVGRSSGTELSRTAKTHAVLKLFPTGSVICRKKKIDGSESS